MAHGSLHLDRRPPVPFGHHPEQRHPLSGDASVEDLDALQGDRGEAFQDPAELTDAEADELLEELFGGSDRRSLEGEPARQVAKDGALFEDFRAQEGVPVLKPTAPEVSLSALGAAKPVARLPHPLGADLPRILHPEPLPKPPATDTLRQRLAVLQKRLGAPRIPSSHAETPQEVQKRVKDLMKSARDHGSPPSDVKKSSMFPDEIPSPSQEQRTKWAKAAAENVVQHATEPSPTPSHRPDFSSTDAEVRAGRTYLPQKGPATDTRFRGPGFSQTDSEWRLPDPLPQTQPAAPRAPKEVASINTQEQGPLSQPDKPPRLVAGTPNLHEARRAPETPLPPKPPIDQKALTPRPIPPPGRTTASQARFLMRLKDLAKQRLAEGSTTDLQTFIAETFASYKEQMKLAHLTKVDLLVALKDVWGKAKKLPGPKVSERPTNKAGEERAPETIFTIFKDAMNRRHDPLLESLALNRGIDLSARSIEEMAASHRSPWERFKSWMTGRPAAADPVEVHRIKTALADLYITYNQGKPKGVPRA